MPKKKSKVKVVPEVVPEVEPEPEPECACYSPETCSGDCPAIEESGGPNFIYEPEPEPEPKPVKRLRPCERVLTPEEIEHQRLHTEARRAKKAAYLASLK